MSHKPDNYFLRLVTNGSLLLLMVLLFWKCAEPVDKKLEENCKTDTCCESSTASSETSEITCPKCGHKAIENLPTEVCQIKYNCEKCDTLLMPLEGDCCVFCTYGTHKCPSMQKDEEEEAPEPVQKTKKKEQRVLTEKEVIDADVKIYDPFEDPDYIGTPCGDFDEFGNCRRHHHRNKVSNDGVGGIKTDSL